MNSLLNFISDEDGVDLAEYALLLGIITLAVASAITAFGSKIDTSITNAANVLK